ncbi:uncharacterized protein [Paramisgurnus dabryanus]|uniref:uncharacterized protein n=1 Tax=Paramisgurnus dabryanus TaxID=90735 RepID=UPI003CCFC411
MIHGQAAERPDANRISECVALKLLKEFNEARNRPRDNKGKVFAIPQAIVMTYSHIKQLLEDCREILEKTNLVLVTVNNTTVSSWLLDRKTRTGRDTLLQGVQFHQHVGLANEPLPKPKELPSAPVQHGHVAIEFQEPENREGEAVIRQRKYARTGTAMSSITHTELGLGDTSPFGTGYSPAAEAQQLPGLHTWPGYSDWSSPLYPPHHGLSFHPPPAPPMPHGWSSLPPGQQPSAPPPYSQGRSSFPSDQQPSAPPPHFQGWSSLPPGQQPSAPPPHSQGWSSFPPGQQLSAPPPPRNRQRAWRLHKAALADQESMARGEPPKKRYTKEH